MLHHQSVIPGNCCCNRFSLCHQLVRRNHPGNESPPLSRLCLYRRRRQGGLPGSVGSYQPRKLLWKAPGWEDAESGRKVRQQDLSTSAGCRQKKCNFLMPLQSYFDVNPTNFMWRSRSFDLSSAHLLAVCVSKCCVGAGNEDITCQGYLKTSRYGVAIDGSDDWHRALLHLIHQVGIFICYVTFEYRFSCCQVLDFSDTHIQAIKQLNTWWLHCMRKTAGARRGYTNHSAE